MSFPPEFDNTKQYTQIYNLDKIDVLTNETPTVFGKSKFISVKELPEILTYGKHYFTISLNSLTGLRSRTRLVPNSSLLFEFKDEDGTVIFSDITNISDVNGASIVYVWVKEDPLRTYNDIVNGIGSFTIAGELEDVPEKWKGIYNYKVTWPIEIRTDLPNTSPILFQDINTIQLSSSFSESIDLDVGDSNYKRSYLNISASHLHTYGGKVDKIELSYREARSQNNEYKVLTTYPLSSSVYEITGSSAKGLNPISDFQKFPTPREIRRNGNVDFKLRFLNSKNEFVENISKTDSSGNIIPNTLVEITGSITGFTGSAVILETADNLVTGSGAIVFGKNIEDGIHTKFGKTDDSVVFEKFKDGIKKERLLELSYKDGGKLIHKPDSNTAIESSGSAILGGERNDIFQSSGSSILAGASNKITASESSTIVSGDGNRISSSIQTVIGGGSNNQILGGGYGGIFAGKDNLIDIPHTGYMYHNIITGHNNQITGSGTGKYALIV
ncbi:hypothetical protein CL614_05810, partial [archaeon]|nr:hypothetical protein [archaeon]